MKPAGLRATTSVEYVKIRNTGRKILCNTQKILYVLPFI